MKYLSNKKGFLGVDNKFNFKEKVVIVPFGLEKTVSYGGGTKNGPKEIIKAQLEVIEEIPADFDPSQRYIEYYLSFDDENWHRINPTGNPTLYMDDGQIAPEVLNINFDVAGSGPNQTVRSISTESPATSVRLKVVMKTDTSLPNSEMYTPVLKKYRVKLFPRTSLSRT